MEEAIAALIGVLVGGAITAGTTHFFALRAEKDRRLSVAYSVFFKFFAIADVCARICRHLEEEWAADANGWHWPSLMPITGLVFPPTNFTSDEMALFAGDGGPLFSERLLTATNHVNLLADVVPLYNRERATLSEELRLRGLVTMAGSVGTITANQSIYQQVAPKIREVESIAANLHDAGISAQKHMISVADDLGPRLKALLNDKRFKMSMGTHVTPS